MSEDIKLQDKASTWATDLLTELEALQLGAINEETNTCLDAAKFVNLHTIRDVVVATDNPLATKNLLLEFWKSNSIALKA